MDKKNKLKKLYDKLELDSTEERLLLSKVKSGQMSSDEIDDLIDIVRATPTGGKVLDEIKDFENSLVTDIKKHLNSLDELIEESNEVAHIEDESIQNIKNEDIRKRYQNHVGKAEEIIDTMKIAYFQIQKYTEYEDRLYDIKEALAYFD